MNVKMLWVFFFLGGFAYAQEQSTRQSFYVESNSLNTKLVSPDPLNYVYSLSKLGFSKKMDWLFVGLSSRMRHEVRVNDLRLPKGVNQYDQALLKQRFFLGINDVTAPFRKSTAPIDNFLKILQGLRFGVEFMDSRRYLAPTLKTGSDINVLELVQGYVGLRVRNALGKDSYGNGRDVDIRFGRLNFELLDRRLVSSNNWRNTTNNFTGLTMAIGQDKNDWSIDLVTVRPIIRVMNAPDIDDKSTYFTSAVAHWRRWSHLGTIEGYYLGDYHKNAAASARNIHTIGARVYGYKPNKSPFNYDVTASYQTGSDGLLRQSAYAYTAELGYAFSKKNGGRVIFFYGYASGDKNPNDGASNRFNRLYGLARGWAADDYIVMENISAPKIRLEYVAKVGSVPVKLDGGYNLYWLASPTDRMGNLFSGDVASEKKKYDRDVNGKDGSFIGHGFDVRAIFAPVPYLSTMLGYSMFNIGEFVRNRQIFRTGDSANTSNFAYIELTLNFFKIIRQYNKNKIGLR